MTQGCVLCLFGVPRHATTWHKVGIPFGDIGILSKSSTFGYTVRCPFSLGLNVVRGNGETNRLVVVLVRAQ